MRLQGSLFILACVSAVQSYAQISGSKDYALGGASVMWFPAPAAIFLNPAELARIHEGEFFVSTNKLANLSSMSATYFEPFVGTFGAGIAPVGKSTQYSLAYSRLLGAHHTIGTSVNLFKDAPFLATFSVGTALHFPDTTTPNSGFHAGISAVNVPAQVNSGYFSATAGMSYWAMREHLRVQMGWEQQARGAFQIGVEVRPVQWLGLLVGARTPGSNFGGVTFTLSHVNFELGAGPSGVSFSLSFRTSDAAADQRDDSFETATDAFDDERYSDAREAFLRSLQFDEYHGESKRMAELSADTLKTMTTLHLHDGRVFEESSNFVEASKRYVSVIKMDSTNKEARQRLKDLQPRFKQYIERLVSTADSLRKRKNFERARKSYELALEVDPQNDSVSARLAGMGSLLKSNLQTSARKAKSHLDRGELDDAQQEFEKILVADPKNPEARSGLVAVRVRRESEVFDKGKALFDEGNFMDALVVFLDLGQRDTRNRELQDYIARTRENLLPEADKFFKAGLQLYVKEDYKAALDSWNKALLIQPGHAAVLEYYKRAEEKLKALEKLQ